MSHDTATEIEIYLAALQTDCDKPGLLARLAYGMTTKARDVFEAQRNGVELNPLPTSSVIEVEARIFVRLCEANGIDWSTLKEH